MSFFQKIKERLVPQSGSENATPLFHEEDQIRHEFLTFPQAYRIGILCYYTDPEQQEIVIAYRRRLEQLGYDCDVLMYHDKKERDNNIVLNIFDQNDLDRRTGMPHSPKTDRFILKKFDLLINLYTQECPPLQHISKLSQSRCRVAPFMEHFKRCSDLMILIDGEPTLKHIVELINKGLNLKPYERKPI